MDYFTINVLHESKRFKLHLCILLLLWEAHFICLGLAFQVCETEIIITYVIMLVVNAVCKGVFCYPDVSLRGIIITCKLKRKFPDLIS